MPIIQTENLSKVFRVPRKDPGVAGAVKALFRPRSEILRYAQNDT